MTRYVETTEIDNLEPSMHNRWTRRVLRSSYVLAEPQADLAAVARAGGRAITRQVAHYAIDPAHALPEIERLGGWDAFWATHLDPKMTPGGTPQQRRDHWRYGAENHAGIGRFGRFEGHEHPAIKAILLQDAEAMLDWPIYREALSPKPQVYVNVVGGIAEATITRGEVEVLQHDWDNLNDGGVNDYDNDDLIAMRERLAQVANSEYRARLLADFDEVMERSNINLTEGADCGADYCVDPGNCEKHDGRSISFWPR